MMIATVAAGIALVLRARPQRGSRRSPSAPWSSRPAGRARRSTRRCCRSPSGSSARCRRCRTSTSCAATRSPGTTTIFVNLRGDTRARRRARHLVPGPQEGRRHPPHPAAGRRRARLQRRVRRHLRDHLRLHRRRLHAARAARLRRGRALAAAARAGRLEDRDPRRPGRADLRRVLDGEARRPRASTATRSSRRSRRRTSCGRRASIQTGDEALSLRVSGAFRSEQDVRDVNFVVGRPHAAARRHRGGDARLRGSAAADVPRRTASRRSASRSRCATGGDVLGARRERRAARWREITAELPVGIEPHARGRPARDRRAGRRRVHGVALAGDRDHPGRAASSAWASARARSSRSRSRSPSSWSSRSCR